jgi:hypothetical protein
MRAPTDLVSSLLFLVSSLQKWGSNGGASTKTLPTMVPTLI